MLARHILTAALETVLQVSVMVLLAQTVSQAVPTAAQSSSATVHAKLASMMDRFAALFLINALATVFALVQLPPQPIFPTPLTLALPNIRSPPELTAKAVQRPAPVEFATMVTATANMPSIALTIMNAEWAKFAFVEAAPS